MRGRSQALSRRRVIGFFGVQEGADIFHGDCHDVALQLLKVNAIRPAS